MQELIVREFSFHQLNANLLWPGTFAFAEWLVQHKSCIEGRRVIELGRYFNWLYLKASNYLCVITNNSKVKMVLCKALVMR